MDSNFKFGMDVKIWCAFCIFGNLIALFFYSGSYVSTVIRLLTTLLFILLLISKRKIALYLLFALYVLPVLAVVVMTRYPIPLTFFLLIKSIIPPGITFVIARRYWTYMK